MGGQGLRVLSASGQSSSQSKGHGRPSAFDNRRVRRAGLHARPVLLPAMSRDPVEADQLACSDLDGADHRAAHKEAGPTRQRVELEAQLGWSACYAGCVLML